MISDNSFFQTYPSIPCQLQSVLHMQALEIIMAQVEQHTTQSAERYEYSLTKYRYLY